MLLSVFCGMFTWNEKLKRKAKSCHAQEWRVGVKVKQEKQAKNKYKS